MSKLATKNLAMGVRPEIELLLCCARVYMDSDRTERIRALVRAGIDWDYLTQTPRWRRSMVPLLYWHLSAICPEDVPQAVLDQFRADFEIKAQRNHFLAEELLKLLSLFKTYGITAVSYKGPVLVASLYGNLALRKFNDLDILVHKRDVMRAKELLISQGYQPDVQRTKAQEAIYFRTGHHFSFVRLDEDSQTIIELELHWRFFTRRFPFLLGLGDLRERLELVSLAGTPVLNFSPEHSLLILCAHGAQHNWASLRLVCDIAELIRVHPDLDWGQVMEQANTLGSERILFLGLHLASDLLGTALPMEVLQKIQADHLIKSLSTQVYEQLFFETDSSYGFFRSIKANLFRVRCREHLQDRVLVFPHVAYNIAKYAITPKKIDRAFVPLPAFLSPLYYVLRPLRLVLVGLYRSSTLILRITLSRTKLR